MGEPVLMSSPAASSPEQAAYSVDVVEEGGLRDLGDDWRRLSAEQEVPNVFTSFEWASAWWEFPGRDRASGGERNLYVVVLRRDGRVSGIAPFVLRRAAKGGVVIRKIEFMDGGLADYNDLLFSSDAAGQCAALVAHLERDRRRWDLLELRNLRDTPSREHLEAALRRSDLQFRFRPDSVCPYVSVQSDWAGFERAMSYNSRRTFRNQRNRLERLKSLRIRVLENPAQESGLLPRIIELERQKKSDPEDRVLGRHESFFQALFESLGPAGGLYIALMEIGTELVAYQLGFRCGRKLWDYTKAHHPDYARSSPGTMLVPAIWDYAFGHGYDEYDFLRGEEAYKRRWARDSHHTAWLRASNSTLRSRAAATLLWRVKPRLL